MRGIVSLEECVSVVPGISIVIIITTTTPETTITATRLPNYVPRFSL
jgi:hypothetical protein